MPTNPYFKNFNSSRHQYLLESQILESIKMFGYDVKYIPRTLFAVDHVYGEDPASTFNQAKSVEIYIKNVDGFAGQGRFMSKFGIEVRDQITFTVSKLRFDQIKTDKLLTENSYIISQEEKPIYSPNQTHGIILEDGDRDEFAIDFDKPREGDLIYFPLVNKIFEIKFVAAETMFYQHGTLFVYDLECEMFEYSSERFNTGDINIDSISVLSGDISQFAMENEDGGFTLNETGGLLTDEIPIENAVKMANNTLFANKVDNIIDWSEVNPLIQADVTKKW